MKKKLFAAIAAGAMLCGMLTAPVSAAETYQKGDVNMDGSVDTADAQRVLTEYIGFLLGNGCTLTPEQIELCTIYKFTAAGTIYKFTTADPQGNTVPFSVADAQIIWLYSSDKIAQLPVPDDVVEYYEQVLKNMK